MRRCSNPINLKMLLSEIASELILQHDFEPAPEAINPERSSVPIRQLVEWIDRTREARKVIRQLGAEWPEPPTPPRIAKGPRNRAVARAANPDGAGAA